MIDLWAEQSDRFIGTTAAILSAIGAGISAGSSIYGANKQAGAAETAAKLQTDAANHAADVQAQSNREALQFEREQAAYAAQQTEVDRHANYDQWAARQRRVGSIGDYLGFKGTANNLPAYVPGVVPDFGSAVASPSPVNAPVSVGAGQTPAAAAMRPAVMARAPLNFGAALDARGSPARGAVPFASSMPPGVSAIDPAALAEIQRRQGGNVGIIPPRYASFGSYLGA
jgi:hypothetical protein